jgi:glycosyltransferase involved in cell wall biosynthesis
MPLNILHIVAPAPAGGLERVVQALAIGHHRRGHNVTVMVVLDEGDIDHPFLAPFRTAGVPLRLLPLPPRAYFAERRAVRALCRELQPQIVHTHGVRPDVVDRSVAADLGIPTITTVHGASFVGGLKGRIYERMQRLQYRRFDAAVAVSRELIEATRRDGVIEARLNLIPNAWGNLAPPLPRSEARRRLDLPPEANVVGWVGRMIPVKGPDLFVEALRLLPEPRPIAVMIGHGPECAEMRRRVAAYGLDVHFHEDVTNAGPLFSAFDVYTLSSRSEGLPVVLLEAMAAGTPIVATRVGGVPDALTEQAAFLVPAEQPAALANAIALALADRGEATRRAACATERLEREFALQPWLDRYEAVYRRALRRSAPPLPVPTTTIS